MPSAFVPSWLNPPDFLGASESGARLGLTRAQMLEQAQEHADSLSASAALERDRLASENARASAAQAENQKQFTAAQALKEAQLKQGGLLGSQRIQNQADAISAAAGLDAARIDALNRQGVQKTKDAHFQDISRQAAAQYKTDNPNVSNAELMSRFPMAFKSNSEIPTVPKAPVIKPQTLPLGIQGQMFKQLLENSSGGTNVDEAISGLKKYINPPATETETPDTEAPAADSLQPATDAGTGLPTGDTGNVATPDIIQKALNDAGGDKQSARQWLQDNGYTIPPAK